MIGSHVAMPIEHSTPDPPFSMFVRTMCPRSADSTNKRVFIHDRVAGTAYYVCCLAIIVYITGYQFVYMKGYLALQTLTGSVRASISVPAAGSRRIAPTIDYCSQHTGLPAGPSPPPYVVEPCLDSGHDTTHFARTYPTACLIGSRVTAKPQKRNATCSDSWAHAASCAPWVTLAESDCEPSGPHARQRPANWQY
jgi:hypothetical protein